MTRFIPLSEEKPWALVRPCPLADAIQEDARALNMHIQEHFWNDPLKCSCGSPRPHCGRCGRYDIFVRNSMPIETTLMCGCVVLVHSIRCRRCGWVGPTVRECHIGIEKKKKQDEAPKPTSAEAEEYKLIRALVDIGTRPKLAYVRQLEDKLGIPEESRIPPEMLR
jgi:hypothetical protein